MNTIRTHSRAVIITVLLLAIILLSGVFYIREVARLTPVKAETAQAAPKPVQAVSASYTTPKDVLLVEAVVSVDGMNNIVNAPRGTVAEFLESAGVAVGEDDKVFPSLTDIVTDSTFIKIIRFSHKEVVEEIETDYETEYIDDNSVYEGESEIEQYGITGVVKETYTVTFRNGKEHSKELLNTEEVSTVQNQIIRRGTKVAEPEPEPEPEPEQKPEEKTEAAPAATEEKPAEEAAPEETTEEEPAPQATAQPSGTYQEYAYSLFPNYGWSDEDFDALVKLWNKESRWNPNAHNNRSGAHGIPQALPGSKMASHGDDWETNGYTQIRWGLDYISRRYGNPSKAWAHSQSHGWY